MSGFLKSIPLVEPIEVFQLTKEYNECQDSPKVNLGVGAYRTDDGSPYILPEVKQAEVQLAADSTLNHEYLPIAGLRTFRDRATELLLGISHTVILNKRWESFQSLGGTGALKLAAEFLKNVVGLDTVYVSNPTWGNHKSIFKKVGFSKVQEYRYWDANTKGLNFEGWKSDIESAPSGSVIILHAVAHNPTGVDPTQEQWKEICEICKTKNHFILMDNAYQGFASGDIENDAWACRYFADQDIEMMIAQSFSKNFGLYGERTGNLVVITKDSDRLLNIQSQMEIIIRTIWSNPPSFGARIVASVLGSSASFESWKREMKKMSGRIIAMRKELRSQLEQLDTPGTWSHITSQIGMFSYTGLTADQVEFLKTKRNIFLLRSGRISMCGLNPGNVKYVAKSMFDAISAYPILVFRAPMEKAKHPLSFVEFAKRKLEETLSKVISTEVVIEGMMENMNFLDDFSVSDKESIEEFAEIHLRGKLSATSTPEKSMSNLAFEEDSLADEDESKRVAEGSDRHTVKTFKAQSVQTLKVQEGVSLDQLHRPKAVPAKFEGTMLTPVYFEGLMLTPDKLDQILRSATESGDALAVPVTFKGGMLTAAFKTMADAVTVFPQEEVAPVEVKFHGRLQGVLKESDIPVSFTGKMKSNKNKQKEDNERSNKE